MFSPQIFPRLQPARSVIPPVHLPDVVYEAALCKSEVQIITPGKKNLVIFGFLVVFFVFFSCRAKQELLSVAAFLITRRS